MSALDAVRSFAVLFAFVALAEGPVEQAASPASRPGAMAANFCRTSTGLCLSWIEPPAGGTRQLRFARLEKGIWTESVVIAESARMVANWADTPAVAQSGDGTLVAHWTEGRGEDPGTYDLIISRSTDGGKTWRRLAKANDDTTATEHGFATVVGEGKGALAVWLDGRQIPDGGAMSLRAGPVGAKIASEVLDGKVCDCCGTAAAITAEGPIVVYRNRSDRELRDVFAVRRIKGKWTDPSPVSTDSWSIPGCPVNGPAVAAVGRKVVVAWYTYAQSQPRVKVAFSSNSGATFGPPIEVDSARGAITPIGRVDVTLDEQGLATVSWMAANREEGQLLVRQVAPDGRQGPSLLIAQTESSRSAGFPRQVRDGGDLVFAWTAPTGVQMARVTLSKLPAPTLAQRAVVATAGPPRKAPELAVKTLEGEPAGLAKLRGRPVLLNFWATWCEPCRMELPVLTRLEAKHRAAGLVVVGVSVDGTLAPAEIKAFAARRGVTFSLWHDPSEGLAAAFGVQTLPASFLIDRAGNVSWSETGAILPDDPALSAAIESVLAP